MVPILVSLLEVTSLFSGAAFPGHSFPPTLARMLKVWAESAWGEVSRQRGAVVITTSGVKFHRLVFDSAHVIVRVILEKKTLHPSVGKFLENPSAKTLRNFQASNIRKKKVYGRLWRECVGGEPAVGEVGPNLPIIKKNTPNIQDTVDGSEIQLTTWGL